MLIENRSESVFIEGSIVQTTSPLFNYRKIKRENFDEIDAIIKHYERFENNFPIKIVNTKQFDTPVNFKQAKSLARHRWYTYKEGFSPNFVKDFITRFSIKPTDIIFDPFGGIGTTVLESSLLGHSSYSNDINPLSNFIATVKADIYSISDINDLNQSLKDLWHHQLDNIAEAPTNTTVTSYFSAITLSSILKIQSWIFNLSSEKIKNIYSIVFLTILEPLSTHRKDGNGVKRKKHLKHDYTTEDLKALIDNQLKLFIDDLKSTSIVKKPTINFQSSFEKYELHEKADLVLTSPPYANCFDYSKVYLVELWFGGFFKDKLDQRLFRQSSITSHVHFKWEKRHGEFGHTIINKEINNFLRKQDLWDKKIPDMLIGYFSDMGKVLYEMIPNLNHNATIGIVVGNSVYGGLPIATDIIIAEIGIKLGYELVGIESYRNITTSSQQQKMIRESDKKFLRESMVIFKWK